MYEVDLALNTQQWLICHKTKPKSSDYVVSSNYSLFIINFCWHTVILFQVFQSNNNNAQETKKNQLNRA